MSWLPAGNQLLDERSQTERDAIHNLVDQRILLLQVVEVLRGESHGRFLSFFLVHNQGVLGGEFS